MNARTLAFLAVLLAAGCGADNFASIQFFEICFPPLPTTGTCLYPAKCDTALLGLPRVDVGVAPATTYLVVPIQINNQLQSNADLSTGRVNTNDAHITKYTITYSASGVPLPAIDAPTNDTVPAAGSTVALVEILPNASVLGLAAYGFQGTMVAHVVATGRYDNGNSFTTGAFDVALFVCSGCINLSIAGACTAPAIFTACPGSAIDYASGQVVSLPFNFACYTPS